MADRSTPFFLAGAVIGAALGYLAGPTIPLLGGHLSITTVATFGSDLRGLDQLLTGQAQTAGKMFYGCALLFALVGYGVGKTMKTGDGGAAT